MTSYILFPFIKKNIVYLFIYIMNQQMYIYKIIFLLKHSNSRCKHDVHGSVHRNKNLIERTNKMQPCSRIYYSNVS